MPARLASRGHPSSMAEGVALHCSGHDIRLKWHRLRRRRSDPIFTGKRLAEGLALGASMEVDVRVHAGEGLVVLHETSLEPETTGAGLVSAASPEYLRGLRIRGDDGAPTDDPVLLLDDLAGLMHGTVAPGALVQLDFKETLDRLTPRTIDSFAAVLGDVGGNIILSGGDWAAVKRLAEGVAGLRKGYDPCDLPEAGRLASAADVAAFVALTERIAPEADMIYLAYPLVLGASALGYDIVDAFHRHGQTVDAWTFSTDHADAAASLLKLAECRVDQITTDEPIRLEEFWKAIAPPIAG